MSIFGKACNDGIYNYHLSAELAVDYSMIILSHRNREKIQVSRINDHPITDITSSGYSTY